MSQPIICFGQQPCGFFPKRFLAAKIQTARLLQKQLGGKIVFFYHDSDADYRETITIMKDRQSGAEARLNFTQENKLQKKHSPLYAKRVPAEWKAETLKQLPRFVDKSLIDLFVSAEEKTAADFCLAMYQKMDLLNGIEIVRSSNVKFRQDAAEIKDGFADVKYKGEIVRAKISYQSPPLARGGLGRGRTIKNNTPSLILPPGGGGKDIILSLHEGGGKYTYLDKADKIEKSQITADADQRFFWMNSVINCTHYVYGEGEKKYLKFNDFPEVNFVEREKIDEPEMAWIG